MHPPLRLQISDIVSSFVSCTTIPNRVTSSAVLDLKTFIRISRVLFRPFAWKAELLNPGVNERQYDQRRKLQEALDREEWYATAEDITRVWMNVFRHRAKFNQQAEQRSLTLDESACASQAAQLTTQLASLPQNNVAPPVRCSSGSLEEMFSHSSQHDLANSVLPRIFESVQSRCDAGKPL